MLPKTQFGHKIMTQLGCRSSTTFKLKYYINVYTNTLYRQNFALKLIFIRKMRRQHSELSQYYNFYCTPKGVSTEIGIKYILGTMSGKYFQNTFFGYVRMERN